MSDAANIQIRINTSEAEKAERVLAALENRSDKLYQSLSNLNKDTSFDKINNAVKGANTSFGKLKAANDSVAQSLNKVSKSSSVTGQALDKMGKSTNDAVVSRFNTSLVAANRELSVMSGQLAVTDRSMSGLTNTSKTLVNTNRLLPGQLSDVGSALNRTAANSDRYKLSSEGLISTLSRLRFAIAAGVAVVAGAIIKYTGMADSYKSMNALLKIATDSTEEYTKTQKDLASVANDSRAPLQDIFSLYSNIAPSLKELGRTQEEIVRSTDLVSKSLKIGGGSAEGHKRAMTQLTQALGSGVLRGDEFNSIMENGRGLAVQLAKGLDVPIGSLREMAEQGELTADVIIDALLRQSKVIDEVFRDIPITSGQAWTLVKNQMLLAIGSFDELTGASAAYSEAIRSVANGIGAFSKTAIAGIKSIGLQWDDFKEKLLTSDDAFFKFFRGLGEVIGQVGDAFAFVIPYIAQFAGAFVGLKAIAALAAGGVALVTGAVGLLTIGLNSMKIALLTNPVTAIIAAIAVSALLIYQNWEPLKKWWSDLWNDVTQNASKFFDWWSGTTLEEKVADITTEVLIASFEIAETLFGWWEASELQAWVAEVETDLVVTAWDYIDRFSTWWDSFDLKEWSAELGTDLLQSAWEYVIRFVSWWGDLDLKALILDFELPTFDSFKSYVGEWVDWAIGTGTAVVDGFSKGVENATSHIDAIKKTVVDVTIAARKEADGMIDVGEALSENMAKGIIITGGEVSDAAADVVKKAITEFDKLTAALDMQEKKLTLSEEAFRRYELGLKKTKDGVQALTVKEIDNIIAREKNNDAMAEGQKLTERLNAETKGLADAQYLQNIALTQGADAARIASLKMNDYSQAQAENYVKTARNMEIQKDFHSALVNSIKGAGSVKDFFGNLGDWMKNWLKDLIAHFIANKIMVSVGSGITGAMGDLSGFLKGIGSGGGGSGGGLTAAGGIDAAVNAGSAGGLAGAAGAAGTIGVFMVGAAAILGKALGGSFKKIQEGFEISFSQAGGLEGQNFEKFKKSGGLFHGSKTKIEFSDLDPEVDAAMSGFFTNLNDTIISQAKNLGVTAADSILDSFSIAATKISSEAELIDFKTDAILQAYTMAFDEMTPKIQEAILSNTDIDFEGSSAAITKAQEALDDALSATVDIYNTSASGIIAAETEKAKAVKAAQEELARVYAESGVNAEELAARFEVVSFAAGTAIPILEQMGVNLGTGFDQMVLSATGLVDTLGGVEPAMAALTPIMNDLFSEVELMSMAADGSRESLASWNEGIGLSGDAMIMSTAGLLDYIRAQEAGTVAGDAAIASAIKQYESAQRLEAIQEITTAATERMGDVAKLLGVKFDTGSSGAEAFSLALADMVGGFDELGKKTNQLINELFTESEIAQLDLSANIADVMELNAALGLFGETTIDTKEELRAFIDSQIEQYGSLAAIPPEIMATILNLQDGVYALEEAGLSLENGLASLPESMRPIEESLNEIGISSGELHDRMIALAEQELATALAAGAGAGEIGVLRMELIAAQTAAATFQESTVAVGSAFDLVNQILGLTGDSAITSVAAFDDYTASLDTTTVAGIQAALTAVQLTGAMQEVADGEATMAEVIASLPPHLQEAFQAMVAETQAAGEGLESAALGTSDAIENIGNEVSATAAELEESAAQISDASAIAADAQQVLADETQATADAVVAASEETAGSIDNLEESSAIGAQSIEDSALQALTAMEEMALVNVTTSDQIVTASQAANDAMVTYGTEAVVTAESIHTASEIANMAQLGMAETLTASAGIVDTATIAMNDSLALMVDEAHASAASVDTATVQTSKSMGAMSDQAILSAGDINTASGTAKTAMDNLAGAMIDMAKAADKAAGIAGNAATSASTSAINAKGFESFARSASESAKSSADSANSIEKSLARTSFARIDGSHATGLDYVPKDNYIANLHKGEMVLPANIAGRVRGNENSSNDDLKKEIIAMRKELEMFRRDSIGSSRQTNDSLRNIAGSSNKQNDLLKDVEKSNERISRKMSSVA